MSTKTIRFSLAAILIGATLPACTSLQTVKVSATSDIASASVRVDVTPVAKGAETVTVHDYWMPGNPTRSGNFTTLHFGPTRSATQEVTNSSWGAPKVLVVADLPGAHSDADSKLILPVSGKGAKKEVDVQVSSSGLTILPTSR